MQRYGENIELYSVFPWNREVVSVIIVLDTIIHLLLGFGKDTSTGVVYCMLAQSPPSPNTCKTTYDNDTESSYILMLLQSNAKFSEKILWSLHASYQHLLHEKRLKVLNGRIVIMIPIASASRFLTLMIVPKDLRRIIFQAYYTIPIGVHVLRYTSLLVILLRFLGLVCIKISSIESKVVQGTSRLVHV